MSATTIAAIRATPVTVPLEAPILHSNGAHWGRFVRTIVEVETADGYVGLGEMGGGGEDATRAFAGLVPYLAGHDVFALEALRLKICNPTASLYNNRTQLHAAIEFACLDIMGQKLGVPVHALLGGKLRDAVEFASYLFFRYADPATGRGEVRTAEQLVANAAALKAAHGFTSHKLKGGVYPPAHELACYRALAASLPGERFRYDARHAKHVARRAVALFDDLKSEHGLSARERLRLEVAALLHDIGIFVNLRGHHKHAQYILSVSEIFGLSRDDMAIISNIARYHRRAAPNKSHLPYMALDSVARVQVNKLAAILRVANALDADHLQKVREVKVLRESDQWVLEVDGGGDLTLERLAALARADLLTEVFGRKVGFREAGARA